MPGKNIVKLYIDHGTYHLYNRGVEKRSIFLNNQDYDVFLNILQRALSPPDDALKIKQDFTLKGETFKGIPKQPKNFHKNIELLAYCLMPNRFHLIIKQNSPKEIYTFIQSIATRYSMYFNKKYNRIGSLFQGPYRAILVTEDSYLLHLSRYIHLNPKEHTDNIIDAYSSYANYIGKRHTDWINTQIILSYFGSTLSQILKIDSYKNFVEKWKGKSEDLLGRIIIEDAP